MAIFTINPNIDDQKKKLLQEGFKYVMLFVIFHILVNITDMTDYGIFSTQLFNYNFIMFLILLVLTYAIYYLIVEEIVEII